MFSEWSVLEALLPDISKASYQQENYHHEWTIDYLIVRERLSTPYNSHPSGASKPNQIEGLPAHNLSLLTIQTWSAAGSSIHSQTTSRSLSSKHNLDPPKLYASTHTHNHLLRLHQGFTVNSLCTLWITTSISLDLRSSKLKVEMEYNIFMGSPHIALPMPHFPCPPSFPVHFTLAS
jgi:hypothetical protein